MRAVLWWLGTWKRGTSYGGVVMGLGMFDGRNNGEEGGGGLVRGLSAWQKMAYGVGEVGGGYISGKWEGWVMARFGDVSRP